MATPILDSIIMQFRRMYGDMYQHESENEITLASQDGQDFSVVEVKDLAIRSINAILTTVAEEVQIGRVSMEYVAQAFTEFKADATVSLSVSGNVGTGSLPASFLVDLGASLVRASGNPRRAHKGSESEFNYVRSGRDPEQSHSPVYRIVGTDVKVAYYDPDTALAGTDALDLQYFTFQADVTQGGATDVSIKFAWASKVVDGMLAQAREFVQS